MSRTLSSAARYLIVCASMAGWLLAPIGQAYADGPEPEAPADAGLEVPPSESEDPPLLAEMLTEMPDGTGLLVIDEGGQALPLVTEAATSALADPDPYYTVGGTLYSFTAADCDPLTPGAQPCANPIQAAIDTLSGNDWTPDDETVYVEAGTYAESVTVLGGAWTTVPSALHLLGVSGSTSTRLDALSIVDMQAFTLTGFSVDGPVYASGNQGSLTLSDVVISNPNGDGLVVDSHAGAVALEDVRSEGNDGIGLDIRADGAISLERVEASGNAYDGAVLEGGAQVSVSDSTFNDNGASGSGESFGLYIEASGDVALQGVTASRNLGDGAGVESSDGDVSIAAGVFQDNHSPIYYWGYGFWVSGYAGDGVHGNVAVLDTQASGNSATGAYIYTSRDIQVDGLIASDNGQNGGWFYTYDDGSIEIRDSQFLRNGARSISGEDSGLYVSASGSVWLEGVTVHKNRGGDGAEVYFDNGATILDSSFTGNSGAAVDYGYGLYASGDGPVLLSSLLASHNEESGAYVYTSSGAIEVYDSAFRCSGRYGLEAYVDDGVSDLTLDAVTGAGNALADFYLDPPGEASGHEPFDCGWGKDEPDEPVEPNVVLYFVEDDEIIDLSCSVFFTILRLLSGDQAGFAGLCGYQASLRQVPETDLTAPLPEGSGAFASAITTRVFKDGLGISVLPVGSFMQVSFAPPAMEGQPRFAILYWDETLEQGQGGWVEMPAMFDDEGRLQVSFRQPAALHEDTPEDGLRVLQGVRVHRDGRISVIVNFTGTFVLVAR